MQTAGGEYSQGTLSIQQITFWNCQLSGNFKSVIESILYGIEKSVTFQDNIKIGCKTSKEHFKLLDLTLTRLKEYGFKNVDESVESEVSCL